MAESIIFIFGMLISSIFLVAVWIYLRIKFETFSYDEVAPANDKVDANQAGVSSVKK